MMKPSRRALAFGLGFALALLAGAWLALQSPAVLARIFAQQAEVRLGQQRANADLFDDTALRVILCGTSAPVADRDRAKSCTLVIAGARAFVVDAGPDSWKTLALIGFPGERIAGVLLTHFHSDHIGDLGEFRLQTWVAGRKSMLPVYGPQGVAQVTAGFNQAYGLDDIHRAAHHGAAIAPIGVAPLLAKPFAVGLSDARDQAETILDDDGLKITAFEVEHAPVRPAVGYRFDYKGRSVVVSGDTARSHNLVKWSKGADVLVHEAQSQRMRRIVADAARAQGNTPVARIFEDIEFYHSSPVDAAEQANAAGVRLLAFTHFLPPLATGLLDPLFFEGVDAVRPRAKWAIGADGLRFDLPLGATTITQTQMPMGVFR